VEALNVATRPAWLCCALAFPACLAVSTGILHPVSTECHAGMFAAAAGAPPERLCEPLMQYITARGGEVHLNSRLQEIELADDGAVSGFRLTDGRRVEGDLYISSMPGQHHSCLPS